MADKGVTLPSWAGGGATGGGKGDVTLPSWAGQAPSNLPSWAKPHKRGFLDHVARYTGAEFVGHLGRDVGEAAVGVVPGLFHVGKASAGGYLAAFNLLTGNEAAARRHSAATGKLLHDLKTSYADYYGHNQLSHLYNHPLQPILDALTVADLGATAGVKAGLVSGERASLITRSPRAIAEGQGPTRVTLTSAKPLSRARESVLHQVRVAKPEGFLGGRIGGEVKAFGKGVHAEANQHALGLLSHYAPYFKATKNLSQREWAALHIRAADVHPGDLAELWKGTPNEKWVNDPKVIKLVESPSKRLVAAETEARRLSATGEHLGLEHGLLTERSVSVAKPPPGLVRLRARTARLEKLHGRALTKAEENAVAAAGPEDAVIGKTIIGPGVERTIKSYRTLPAHEGPVTEASARARLAELEAKHEGFHEQVRSMLFGDKLSPADMAEQRFRNKSTGRARRQQSAKANKSFHGTYKSKVYKTVKQEQLDEAIKHVTAELEKNPDAPHAKAYLAEEAQIAALRDALNPLPGDAIDIAKATAAMRGAVKPKAIRELVAERKVRGPGRVVAAKGSARADRLGAALSVTRDELQRAEEKFARNAPPPRVGGTVQRVGLAKRAAEEALGRPVRQIHGNPFYIPHAIDEEAAVNPLGGRGGGKAAPLKPGTTKRSNATLFLHGKMALRRDVLGPEFLRRVKYVKYDEIHNALVRGAVRVTKKQLAEHYDGRLPKGYEYIRVKASDRIPATMRGESDIPAKLTDLVPNPDDLHSSPLAEGFTTTDVAQAARGSKGEFYIVPTSMSKAATGEFTKAGEFTRAFVQRPLAVWRAIVLGLRPGFLTNNLVGNSIMYAVRTAGTGAIRDLFKSILEQHGATVARKALDNPATPPALRQSLYDEFFPEQVAGTFGRTQSPSTGRLQSATSRTGKTFRTTTGAIPKLTAQVAEVGFRRGLIRNYIRNSPEFKAVYRSLPKDTRTFEAAARQLLEGKGGKPYQRYISKKVNDSLGDYLNLSPVERNVLRNTLPFYAWYKAIVTTTGHLAVDAPLRANILGRIGQIGKQWSDQQLGEIPSFLEGAIPLGLGPDGTKRVLGTQGLNPYATLEQLRKGGLTDVSSLGVNPFVTALLDSYANARAKNFKVSGPEVALAALESIAKNLPLSQVIRPNPPSALYPTRGRRTTSLAFLGVPIKEYNPAVAASQAAAGR